VPALSRPPLHPDAAERGLVGAAFGGGFPALVDAVGAYRVDAASFSLPGLGLAFAATVEVRAAADGEAADVLAVWHELRRQADSEGAHQAYGIGVLDLHRWAEERPPDANVGWYASVVAEAAHGRTVRERIVTAAGRAADPDEEPTRTARWLTDELAALDASRPGTGASGSGLRPSEEREFWSSRKSLSTVRDFAWSRLASPWATLGVVLVRVISQVPPSYVLPPIVGSPAALNLYLALVGESGSGKDAAEDAAPEAFDIGADVHKEAIGTGEGVVKTYVRWNAEENRLEQVEEAAVFDCLEIDKFAALMARPGATLPTVLREAWTGKRDIGFSNAEMGRRLKVGGYRYRLCVTLGVQPGRAGCLLNDAEIAGGGPQRYLWLPATDPSMPDATPEPAGMAWDGIPEWPQPETSTKGLHVLPVCTAAAAFIRRERLRRVRGQGSPLDSHAPLNREKWAAALAFMEGHIGIEDEDWELAGVLMRVSDHTRDSITAALESAEAERNRKRGAADAVRRVVVDEQVDAAAVKKACKAVVNKLSARPQEWTSESDLRTSLWIKHRPHLEDALRLLTDSGQIKARAVEYQGHAGMAYSRDGSP
jgi:hypothetical protein